MLSPFLIILLIIFAIIIMCYFIYVSYQMYKKNPNRFLKIWFIESIVEVFI